MSFISGIHLPAATAVRDNHGFYMKLPGGSEIESASRIVYEAMRPTLQHTWPLLNQRLGAELWLKHENHTPVGSFKIRGGLTYFRHLRRSREGITRVVTATRGNHGQAVGFAARREGVEAIVYVPRGNSASKNRAMRGMGVTLVEHGGDFEEARQEALRRARQEDLHYVPSFHELLIAGVATYSHELFSAVADVDVAYVPIGLGSGICGMVAAREALGLKTEIVGVVSRHAPAYYDSFVERRPVEHPAETEIADGVACSVPEPDALDIIWRHVARVVMVTDDEIAAAMRILFDDTHNAAEGAGAAALAAALQEKRQLSGKRVAAVLSGGNIDRDVYSKVLAGADCGSE
jgi:threonine dehydratase